MTGKAKRRIVRRGIAILTHDEEWAVRLVRRTGYVCLRGRPRHLVASGGVVIIVGGERRVLLVGKVERVSPAKRVTLLDRLLRNNGYRVYAKWRLPRAGERRVEAPLWIDGQMGYFDPADFGPAVVGLSPQRVGSHGSSRRVSRGASPRAVPIGFTGGIPGKSYDHPESRLVRAYTRWINDPGVWDQYRLDPEKWVTDLFDQPRNRLIEAKYYMNRKSMRSAIGQLLDYKRYFDRKPSLGVLFPEKPDQGELRLFKDCRTTVVWRTPTGGFADSADGRWTDGRRID